MKNERERERERDRERDRDIQRTAHTKLVSTSKLHF